MKLVEVMRVQLAGDPTVLEYSPNGEIVAIGYTNGNISLWRVGDDSLLSTFPAHAKGIGTLQFTSDSKKLVSIGGEQRLSIWSTPEGKNINSINDVGWSGSIGKDDRVFAAKPSNQTVVLWDLQTREQTKQLSHKIKGGIYALAYTVDAKYLITAYMAGLITDVDTGAQSEVMRVPTAPLRIDMLSGNQAAISLGNLNDETAPVRNMVPSRKQQTIAILRGWDGKPDFVELWDVEKKSKLKTLKLNSHGGNMSFSSDDCLLAIGNKKEINIWELKKAMLAVRREGGGQFQFSPTSPELAVTDAKQLIVLRVE